MELRKFIEKTVKEFLNEQINTDMIKYYGKLTSKEIEWLVRIGRRSYSGSELRPIFYNDTFIGGISWNLGGIDYIEFLPEFINKGYLKYIVYDNIDNNNNNVIFVSASDKLKKQLSNYGQVFYDEDTDHTIVKIDDVNKS